MDITINTETGNGYVKAMKGGVGHETGFVGGDTKKAVDLGITEHVDSFWTDEIKAKFAADEAERAVKLKEDAKVEAAAKAKALAEEATKAEEEEAAMQKRIDDAVAKALSAKA